MRNILIVAALFLSTPALLSSQSIASLSNVNQAKQEVSNAVRFIEQNILLALTAGVVFLGIIFVCYVIKEYAHSNRAQQAKRNHFLSLLLVVGIGAFCSSCGLSMQMQPMPSDTAQKYIQHGCPHHHFSYQEPFAFTNVYRTIGFPAQRSSICKFCGQRIANNRD